MGLSAAVYDAVHLFAEMLAVQLNEVLDPRCVYAPSFAPRFKLTAVATFASSPIASSQIAAFPKKGCKEYKGLQLLQVWAGSRSSEQRLEGRHYGNCMHA